MINYLRLFFFEKRGGIKLKDMEKLLKEGVFDVISQNGREYSFVNLNILKKSGFGNISLLPFSIKILLEAVVRQYDGNYINYEHIEQLANWQEKQRQEKEIPFKPARILFQDFTGIPALVDLATIREEINRRGGDMGEVNPQIPVDLVIDHSVIIDHSGNENSFSANLNKEYEQNNERYRFVKWAQNSFQNFRAVPPSNGIVHQVNLEYLASPITIGKTKNGSIIYPDSLVGTDSHTPMINGLGIVGWGVGGIEAEAAMLGQPLYFVMPEVIGYKLHGKLQEGVTATDLALTITNLLRKKGVVGKYIEFFGNGLDNISLTDRATIANMAPEYGATMGYFPVDNVAMNYFEETGRGDLVPLAKAYYKIQGLYRTENSLIPEFTEIMELDLSIVEPLLAGPKRPQDSLTLGEVKLEFENAITAPIAEHGYGLERRELDNKVRLENGEEIKTGSIVLAAITSCTNTSNPSVMIAAGLVAKKAVEKGLKKPSFVKSSLTPGSRVVTKYLDTAGLLAPLKEIGFFLDGYGCATCCGNSGSLDMSVEKAIRDNDLLVSSVLSGNRNFEGRVHPLIKANYLGSPPLVVAYALAGTIHIDLFNEPIAISNDNEAVYLKDIWPSSEEVNKIMSSHINKGLYHEEYQNIFQNDTWSSIPVSEGLLYKWDDNSTYIKEAPYFKEWKSNHNKDFGIKKMKTLLMLKDSITTDHISPAGHIPLESPAGVYLTENKVSVKDFNNYGARRGNHHVMMRGTFGNIRIRNKLADGIEGGVTKYLPTGEIMSVFDAAKKYKESDQNLIIIAGKEYGTGSSRDWAAKGTFLLGVKAVLAESFERIHRSNLVGMGVLPLQFIHGENAEILGLDGTEFFSIIDLNNDISPKQKVRILVEKEEGDSVFEVTVRLDSKIDVEYYLNGGILHTVLENILSGMKGK